MRAVTSSSQAYARLVPARYPTRACRSEEYRTADRTSREAGQALISRLNVGLKQMFRPTGT